MELHSLKTKNKMETSFTMGLGHFDETCQSIIKQSTQQKGRKMYKMEGPKSPHMSNPPKTKGKSLGEWEQIKYLNLAQL